MTLRTKIVATIGTSSDDAKLSYSDGIANLDSTTLSDWTKAELARRFLQLGVDVLRVNLAHIENEAGQDMAIEVGRVLGPVRQAILNFSSPRRVAVIVDLPGPKIRFDGLALNGIGPGDEFVVALEASASGGSAHRVNIGDEPLRSALEGIDRQRIEVPATDLAALQTRIAGHFDKHQLVENLFSERVAGASSSYEQLLDRIEVRLASGDGLDLYVGEADLVVGVRALDRQSGLLRGKVKTARSSTVKGRKGFTIKGVDFDLPAFTSLDEKILEGVLKVDWPTPEGEQVVAFIGLSFAQTADDILRARHLVEQKLRDRGLDEQQARLRSPAIIAKIETEKGWKNRDFILDVADGVMVARGDLGLQIDIERVPAIQKQLIRLCNQRGKPVITATQMLTSMTDSVEPTRAEVTDVFNAIEDGSDAVMMSEETAKGRFPFHAIQKMASIAVQAERYFELEHYSPDLRAEARRKRLLEFMKYDDELIGENEKRLKECADITSIRFGQLQGASSVVQNELSWRIRLFQEKARKAQGQATTNRVTESACLMAEAKDVDALVTASTSGRTTRMVARLRPRVLTIGAAHDPLNTRKLAVSYGVAPIHIGAASAGGSTEDLFQLCKTGILNEPSLASTLAGKTVVFTSGFPLQRPGTTNTLQLRKLER